MPEPFVAKVLTALLFLALAAYLFVARGSILPVLHAEWPNILFWTLLVVAVNLWPLTIDEITLTLDMPILLSIGLLYPPPVAALVGLAAAMDVREVARAVPFTRAVFNRIQVATCVLAASAAFHGAAAVSGPWLLALAGTLLSVGAFNLVNMSLVGGYTWLRLGHWSRFTVGEFGQFLITYIGYGLMALVLARLFAEIGAWSVVSFLIPIAVARQALIKSENLQTVTEQLKSRERLLRRLLDRMSDERLDERRRIASGLHDDVLQSLIRIGQLSHFLRNEVEPHGDASRDATQISSVAKGAIQQLREVVNDLRRSPLGRGGLVAALENLIRDLELEWRSRIQFQSDINEGPTEERQIVLYQVAREGLVNALKHAQASRILVVLVSAPGRSVLRIEDDGRGFNVGSIDGSAHLGLGLMQERVESVGGELTIRSRLEGGTKIEVQVPTGEQPSGPAPPSAQTS